ncbi:hypothetical protein N7509_011793 [Penicillium cosmopolitanum]|uniref:Fungal N-terminal domain-containing protein n=1 Tax=Penicillium cosmopolitanum TaxID=1131564 RepID=A0A9W9SJ70_9EURO|nr:uncharacterized protein N7509_011793 [Penicillium cosmopolitanum]KAJ5378674.1 hypothetical protein N7509_011793 [Penicillium cosmopolitanum]
MAEAIGFASAGVGVASFVVQIFSSISALKATHQYNREQAPRELHDLTNNLEFLKLSLESLQPFEGNPLVNHAIRNCQSMYSDVNKSLKSLLEKMHRSQSNKKTKWKFDLSPQVREQIEDIGNKISRVIQMLNT